MRSEVQVLLDPPLFWGAEGLGALAQLGERLICIQEVIGSIPIGSTIIPSKHQLDHQAHLVGLIVQLDGN